jgi:RNase P/RNase MRP subunit p30
MNEKVTRRERSGVTANVRIIQLKVSENKEKETEREAREGRRGELVTRVTLKSISVKQTRKKVQMNRPEEGEDWSV